MKLDVFWSLGVSLVLTLVLEGGYALLCGIQGRDLRLLLLANVLTNPVVVLAYHLAGQFWPTGMTVVVVGMELWAVGTEGYLFRSRSRLTHPWRFAVCANLISYTMGCFL